MPRFRASTSVCPSARSTAVNARSVVRNLAAGGLAVLLSVVSATAVPGQTTGAGRDLLPQMGPLPRLDADPREPSSAGRLLYITDPDTPLGHTVQGEATLGGTFPIYRLWGQGSVYGVLAVRAGVFARFSLQQDFGALISADWVFSVPLVVRSGDHWYRLGYFHYSAHTGDAISSETIEDLGLEDFRFERNALEGLASFGLTEQLNAYAGALFSFLGSPKSDQPGIFGGFELKGPNVFGFPSFLASHVTSDPRRDWATAVSGQAGLVVGVPDGRRIRLAVEAFSGSSPQRQFFQNHTSYVGLAMYYDF